MAAVTPVPSGPHGGDGARLAESLGVEPSLVLDLSASLNPVAPPIDDLVVGAVGAVGRYPDPEPGTAAVAEMIGVDRDRLILTNGGAEAIALVGAALARYQRHIPPTSRFRIFGWPQELTDKAFVALAAAQVGLARGGASLLPMGLGFFFGAALCEAEEAAAQPPPQPTTRA